MTFSPTVLSILAVAGVALSVAAMALVLVREARLRAAGRTPPVPTRENLEQVVAFQARAIQRLEGAVRQLAARDKKLEQLMGGAIQNMAVVRFDAFEDMGGRLSFSAALLDGHGDGVVVTSINGRQDTRCYAKQIQGGTSIHNLSDEEEQAIREALSGARQTVEAR